MSRLSSGWDVYWNLKVMNFSATPSLDLPIANAGKTESKTSMLKTISVNPISTVASKRCSESSTAVLSFFLYANVKTVFRRLIHVTWRVDGWMPRIKNISKVEHENFQF